MAGAVTGAVTGPAPNGDVAPAHISPVLDKVAISGSGYSQAKAAVDELTAGLDANRRLLVETTARIGELDAERIRLAKAIFSDTALDERTDRRIATLRARLRRLALRAYVGIGDAPTDGVALTLDSDDFLEARTASNLREAATATTHDGYVTQLTISARVAARLKRNREAFAVTTADLAEAQRQRAATEAAIERGTNALPSALERLRDMRATAIVDGTDLPLVVLDTYFRAAQRARLVTPGCHLEWSLLAGIGKVESGQGTHGGASVRQDGTLTRPIYGVPLDGTQGNATIVTAGGGFMRAEGPMQFLPSTWAAVSVDGDGDGRADIQNLYDAAASAGAYLCRNGVDLATPGGLRAAILSYNFSGEYVAKVTGAMAGYAEALPTLPAS